MNNTDILITKLHEELIFKEQKINELHSIIKEIREIINNMKPLNEEETDMKEMLKEASSSFKTICHLEDFEVAIWNIQEILVRSKENV